MFFAKLPFAHRSVLSSAALLLSTLTLGCGTQKAPSVPQGQPALGPDQCIGINPSIAPKPPLPPATVPQGCPRAGVCIGQPAPNWQAYDFQTLSCGFGQKYGIKDFIGKPTLVVHLAGWCGYCQYQTVKLEKMRLELKNMGLTMNFVVINAKNANSDKDRKELLDRCSFSVFQDHPDFEIWKGNGGGKDDMYIYDIHGRLLEYLPHDTTKTNLSDEAIYNSIKEKLAKYIRESGSAGSGSPGPGSTASTSTMPTTSSSSTQTAG